MTPQTTADQITSQGGQHNLTELTGTIVSAFVANNSLPPTELPSLINSVFGALTGLGQTLSNGTQTAETAMTKLTPAQIKKSITPDFITSFEDGKQYKSLKRHLSTRGLTPEQYRQKWGLPPDYLMVAPNYAKQRSELAKSLGLGQIRAGGAQAQAEQGTEQAAQGEAEQTAQTSSTPRRSRSKKAA